MAVALMTGHISMDHSQAASFKPTQIPRPELSAGETSKGWQYFLNRWKEYSQAANLTAPHITIQLLACLDPKLRRDVTMNATGPTPLREYTEPDLLAAIKAMAVQEENKRAARVTLSRMTQDRGETVRSFVARLRGQAEVCRFDRKCTGCETVNSQSEDRVADQLCVGLADPDIQADLLKEPDRNQTVEELVQFIMVRVTGKQSFTTMTTPPQASNSAIDGGADKGEALRSGYKRQQQHPPPKATPPKPNRPATPKWPPTTPTPHPNSKTACCFCGRQGHGTRARTAIRRTQCPAFGKTCQSCGRPNHTAQMCWQTTEQESAIQEVVSDMTEGTLPHQTWDQTSQTWAQRRSPPQPTLNVAISTHRADFQTHGHTLRKERRNIVTRALADTGCQSCLAGPTLMRDLDLRAQDLIPASLTMSSASGNTMPIMGAALTRIRAEDTDNETRQMVYFSPLATKLYLSMSACSDLGLINLGFPLRSPAPLAQIRDKAATPQKVPLPTRSTGTSPPPTRAEQADAEQVTPCRPATHTLDTHTPPALTPQPAARPPSVNQQRPCSCPTRSPPPDRPTTLPFPATEGNRQKLEKYLLDLYSSSAFNTCEHQPLPMMSGPPLSLKIDPNAAPKPCHTPITIPVHWQEEVKAGLDRDVRLGVLEKVPLGTPVTWCHRMVICTKKNGSLRRTINFQPLNQHATRETHHCQSPFHQARSIPRLTKKTIFDAWNGYHSVALAEEDRHYTTFITPWGRYRYLTAPQGYIASGDAYTARYDALITNVPNKTKCIDDALLWADDIEGSFHQAVEWLHICATNGITLNPEKFRFAEDEVEFAGFTVTPTEVRPASKFTAAIKEFPTPTSITDIRAWFGLVNQISYTFAMTATMLPFRDLLKPSTPFQWSDQLTEAFTASKQHICESIRAGVEIFDKGRPTCLATDWSKDGIGFWLTQKHCKCPSRDPFCCRDGWRVTLVGSRFTHAAESRYAPVEGEALAVADALDRTRHFVLGCRDLTIAVDHKPLLKLFGDRCLEDIPNPRLRNIKEKTLRYHFRMVYIPGTRNLTSDALSRHPSGTRAPTRLHLPDDLPAPSPNCSTHALADDDGLATAMCAAISTTPINWEQLQTATTADQSLQDLMLVIEAGPPTKRNLLPVGIQAYFPVINDLTIVDDVVCLGDRLVIPSSLRQACLATLHIAHQGTSGMTARAKASIYWPGLTADIAATRSSCNICNGNAPSQPHMPPITPEEADHPFEHLHADFFHHEGSAYLVLVDRFSGWPIVSQASSGAAGLTQVLRETFATFGIPATLTTDGGPEFTAHATRDLLTSWGVHHRISSAYHPHANNRAETGVKTIKRLIAGNTDSGGTLKSAFFKALLTYRNCPCPDTRMSPAMCLFGRPIRDLLPTLPTRLQQPTQDGATEHTRQTALQKRQHLGKKRWTEHTKGLSPLKRGDRVLVQNQTGHHPTKWDSTGVVVEVMQYHQYQVRMDSNGRTTTRNRQYLRRNTTPIPPPDHPLQRCLPHPQPPVPPRPTTQPATPPRQPLPGTPATPRSQPLPGTPAPPPSQPLPGTPPPPPSHPSPGTPPPPPSHPSPGTLASQPSPGIPAPPPSQPSPGTPASQHVAGPPEPPQLPMTHTTTQRQPTATPATTRSYAAAAGTPATRDNLPPLAPKKLAKIPPPPPKPTNPDQTLRRSTRTRKPRQF